MSGEHHVRLLALPLIICCVGLTVPLAGCKDAAIGVTCGNGEVDPGEVCDGPALGGESCLGLTGLADGVPTCALDCRGFDTSGCHDCGDGVLESGEECDGAAGPRTCADLGLTGGALTCGADCRLDRSQCTVCGNGTCDPDETENSCPEDCLLDACPPASPGGPICLTGCVYWLVDPVTHGLLTTPLSESPVTPGGAQLRVSIYDPLSYAVNPGVAPLAVTDTKAQSGCFLVESVTVPGTGFLLAVVDDHPDSAEDHYAFTGVPLEALAGVNQPRLTAVAVSTSQDLDWTAKVADAGLAAPCEATDTLGSCGTWVGLYGAVDGNGAWDPLAGVTPLVFPGPVAPELARIRFLDPGQDSFTRPASAADLYTTATGVVFFAGSRLGSYSGRCADLTPDSECEAGGYTWDEVAGQTGGSTPGAYVVQLLPGQPRP